MMYNSSTHPKDTPGNYSVVPEPLHVGRANATISSPTVFRLIRPKQWYETNLSAWDRKFTNDTTEFVKQTDQQEYVLANVYVMLPNPITQPHNHPLTHQLHLPRPSPPTTTSPRRFELLPTSHLPP